MSNYHRPRQRNQTTLDYIKANFSVVDGVVSRKDGYTGSTHINGYKYFVFSSRMTGGEYTSVFAHHISWYLQTGRWPEYELDHFDDNPQNNAFDNLREVKGNHRKEQYDYAPKYNGRYVRQSETFYDCYLNGSRYIGYTHTESEAAQKVAMARIDILDEWEEPFIDRKQQRIEKYLQDRKART